MSTTIFPESGDQITESAWATQNQSLTVAERYRVNGYTLSAGTGLNADVAAGTCVVNGYHIVSGGTQAVAVTASNTNYIWLNEDGTLSANTTGANPGSELLLGTAIADGSSVTSVSHDYDIANSQYVYIRKAADESVNNSTTYQDDDDFAFAVADGSQWEIDAFLSADHPDNSSDLKIKFTGSGGATVTQRLFFFGSASSTGFFTDFSTTEVVWDAESGADRVGHVKAMITVSGAGTVTMQWAQDTAFAGNTTINQDSVLVARRVIG